MFKFIFVVLAAVLAMVAAKPQYLAPAISYGTYPSAYSAYAAAPAYAAPAYAATAYSGYAPYYSGYGTYQYY